MLSKTNRNILISLIKIGSYWGGSPITCHATSKSTKFQVLPRPYQRFLLILTLWWLQYIYLCCRFLHLCLTADQQAFTEFQPFWKTFFAWILFTALTMTLTMLASNGPLVAAITNDWISMMELIQVRYFPTWDENEGNGCEILMKGIFIFACITPLTSVMDFLLNPLDALYVTSLFRNHQLLLMIFYVPYATVLFHLYIMCCCPGAFIVCTCMVPVLIAGKQIIQELKPQLTNFHYKALDRLRQPKNAFLIYRCSQIFMGKVNDCFQYFLLPIYNVQTYCLIISTFQLIRFHKDFDSLTTLSMCVVSDTVVFQWTVILYVGGLMIKKSSGLIDYWRRTEWRPPTNNKYIKRVCKSFKPVSLRFGVFYTVRTIRVLMFFHFILWGTLRALLIF